MIKKTLYFGNPGYLSLSNNQLTIKLPEVEKSQNISDNFKRDATTTIPIEDVALVVLDHPQITLTNALLSFLNDCNVAIVVCDSHHLPLGLMLPMFSHSEHTERLKYQLESSIPLRKNLWQQTIEAKIRNQAEALNRQKKNYENMLYWSKNVKSGDAGNKESQAAAYYWNNFFDKEIEFVRGRFEDYPNNLLNYTYAIVRAMMARALVSTGLLPTLGIKHSNKYNPYCLADDIMEPYRPFADMLVLELYKEGNCKELNRETKARLLQVATVDVKIDEEKSPLMVAMNKTAVSLFKCFKGDSRKIEYPEFI